MPRKVFSYLFLLSLIFGFFLFSQNSKSYDDKTTHPAITDEIVDFYNLSFDSKLTVQEKEWIVQGSIDEDTPPRWINHFYDPITGDGWKAENLGGVSPFTLQLFSKIFLNINTETVSSKNWVHNELLQAKYADYDGNRTWENAIRRYAEGDREYALKTLGHILHLLEDATVPDHTRNDTHAHEGSTLTKDGGSPYEDFGKNFNRANINIAQPLKNENKQPVILDSIDAYFDALANYSNQYFFSEHTILSEKYQNPKILRENENYGYGKDKNGDKFVLIEIKIETRDDFNIIKNYTLKNEKVLSSYFSRLSSAAVLHGAGATKLFIEEAEKAKNDKSLIKEEPKISWWQKARSPLYGSIQLYNSVSSSVDNTISKTIAIIDRAVEGVKDAFSVIQTINPLATTANISGPSTGVATNLGDQVANQTESGITNQESGILNQSVEVEPLNSKEEVQPQHAGPIPSVAEKVQSQKQSEIIHAPYQWPQTDEKIEIIHAPWPGRSYGGDKVGGDQNVPIIPASAGGGGDSAGNSNQSANNPSENSGQASSTDSTNLTQDNSISSTDQGETPATNTDQSSATSQPIITEDLTPPPAPMIITNNGANYIIKKFASQYPERKINLTLEGTKSQDTSEIFINNSSENVFYPTQTSWKKDFILPAGDNVFEIKAKDSAGNISESTIIKITLQFSDVKFYLTNYDVRKTNFTLNWQDSQSAVQSWELQYKLGPNFGWAEVEPLAGGSTSLNFTAKYDDLTYYFRLRGSDANGNQTDWQYLQADISTKPVVINEVAWMGTQASTNDEWIELANKTNQEIDLKGWTLKTSDGGISIVLSGKISPNGFYLLERTNDDSIKNIQADQIYTGALRNPGMYDYGQLLQLSDAKGDILDDTYTAFVGDNAGKKTEERISIWSSGMERKNWKTYIGSGGDAQDASGNKILGTPKVKNSQADLYYYLPDVFSIDKDAIFSKNKGPYISDNLINISQPVTLNIEPGTVLKFGYLGGLDIHGKLLAKGTTDNKIIFTSSDDDQYGGDTNGDGQIKIINWRKFIFNDGSSGEINNSLFRYAGNVWTTDNEVVYINKSSVKISGSVFENMGKDVLYFNNSDVDLSANEFKNNNSNAVYIYQSKGNVTGSIFNNNKGIGIYVGAPSGRINISGNSFTKNKAPIRLDNFGDFGIDLNQVSNNNYNGILVYASNLDKGDVLLSADMPFVIMGFPVIQSGATLEVAAGTIIKFDITDIHGLTVNGTLKAVGTAEKPIIFTSLYDDQYGGDTNNDGAVTAPRPGLWAWIDFAGSKNSVIEDTIIKYGGQLRYSMGGSLLGGSGISIESGVSNFVLKNSTISNSVTGMTVAGDGVIIENSTFSNNNLISDNGGMSWRGGVGLDIAANNITVSKVVFNNNGKAFQSGSAYMATILLSDLIFNQNTYNYWPENLMSQINP